MNYKTKTSTTEHIIDNISEKVILENAYGQKYIIGQPDKKNLIEMKLKDKSLHYKLYLY